MSLVDVAAFFRTRLEQNWTATALRFQNEQEDAPKASDGAPLPFVFVEVAHAPQDQASWGTPGANLFRSYGTLMMTVLVERSIGDPPALQYATQLGALFRGQDFGTVRCQGVTIGEGAAGGDNGNYWCRVLSIDFWFDETA